MCPCNIYSAGRAATDDVGKLLVLWSRSISSFGLTLPALCVCPACLFVFCPSVMAELETLGKTYPFSIPPFFALILRAFSVIEGIALTVDPDYSIVQVCACVLQLISHTQVTPMAPAELLNCRPACLVVSHDFNLLSALAGKPVLILWRCAASQLGQVDWCSSCMCPGMMLRRCAGAEVCPSAFFCLRLRCPCRSASHTWPGGCWPMMTRV